MQSSQARSVSSNQQGVHPDLIHILHKHCQSEWLRPIAQHTKEAFEKFKDLLQGNQKPLILDSGCGVGKSTCMLAWQNPNHLVIGVEKSGARLEKFELYKSKVSQLAGYTLENLVVIRADLLDFWRLLLEEKINIERHYILYPNPYPKKSQLAKRWQGHGIFPTIHALCSQVELRTNWETYAQEFTLAWNHLAKTEFSVQEFEGECFTPFEEKYAKSEQKLWKLKTF